MKKILVITLAAWAGLFFCFKTIEKAEWIIDKQHAKIGFSVGHMMISEVDGQFRKFDAKITASKEDFSDAVATMTADVNSIDTDNDKRDADLRSANYFDAAKYPTLSFKSTSFKKVDDHNYTVTGDMTIRGITKPVVLNAYCRMGTHPMSKKAIAGFKVTGKINRLDFAVGAGASPMMVDNEISLVANVEFEKNQPISMR